MIAEIPPLVVRIGRQLDGCAFELDPHSRAWMRRTYPDRNVVRQVFVAFDTTLPVEALHVDVKTMVTTMLTGLSPEEVEAFGVRFEDPAVG